MEVVMRPITSAEYSVNHSAPSGPVVIELTPAEGPWSAEMDPLVVIRLILLPVLPSPNHRVPSGPTVIPVRKLVTGCTGYSVMGPILAVPCSVNQSAPSGPAVILNGLAPGVRIGYSVKLTD